MFEIRNLPFEHRYNGWNRNLSFAVRKDNFKKMQAHKGILILLLTLLTQFAMSQIAVNTNQQQDSTKAVHQYSGLVTVTNNGIS